MTSNHDETPQIFDFDYYERLFEIEERHWWAIGLRAVMDGFFQETLAGRRGLRALDIGCGTGYLLHHLARYPLDGEVFGLDYSPHALAFCRRRGSSRLVLGSAGALPVADGTFDLAISIDTIQHLWPAGSDRVSIAEVARVLRPNGFFYLRTNSALGHRPLRGVDPDLYRRYRRPQLLRLIEDCGLVVERASYVNMVPAIWGMIREFLARPRGETRAIGPGLAIQLPRSARLNRLLLAVLKGEAALINGAGVSLPFGHSLALLARKV